MKMILIAAAVLLPAAAGAVTLESAFLTSSPALRASVLAAAQRTPSLETPAFRVLGAGARRGSELGRFNLAAQLDRNLFLMKETLGSRLLDVGIVADAGAKTRFLSFTDGAGTTLGKIGSLGDLRGKGMDIRIDASTVYNFRVEVGSIFDDPVHKSILHITPTAGTHGPTSQMTTGALLNAMRAKSGIVTIEGDEYWFFYGREAVSDGSGFSKDHGFLVTHEAGMSTKAWPIEESALPLDTPTAVTLGDVTVQMTRTSSGDLIVGGN